MERVRAWFAERSAAERRTLLLGGIAAAILLLLAVLLPLHRSVARTAAHVATLRSDLAWLRSVAPQLQAAGNPPVATPDSLVVVVDRAARAAGIAGNLSPTQSGAAGQVEVHFDKVSFDGLATWLGQLAMRYGVQVESATVESAGAPGLVRAAIVLRQR